MLGAGILAKKAVERGLYVKPWVKTSLAPGSKVVTEYLKDSGLLSYLEKIGFYLVGYGCTTCIGNSGPLPEPVGNAIQEGDLVAAAVLSGNRNFEGRIHANVRANYLASPPLVVAYALAGFLLAPWLAMRELPRVVEEKIFPGYVLVEMIVTDDSWYVVRNTPNVTGFIGTGTIPTPISEEEMAALQKRMGVDDPEFKLDVQKGDVIEIVDGPFKNTEGKVAEIDEARGKIKVLVSMFGRETPVELDFLQVKKS